MPSVEGMSRRSKCVECRFMVDEIGIIALAPPQVLARQLQPQSGSESRVSVGIEDRARQFRVVGP